MQLVSENRLLFGGYFSKRRATRLPVSAGRRGRHQMKLNHRQGQTINDTLAVLGDIQTLEYHSPNKIEGLHQAASATIEAALRRNAGKQVTMPLPMTEHLSFHIPATTLAH